MPKEKSKKNKEPKISYFQAITSYKINIKEKELKEINEELSKLSEKNNNLKTRNKRLNQTKDSNMEKALDDYKTFNNEVNSKKRCEKDEVINEMKDLWRFMQQEERALLTIRKEIRKTEREINLNKRELKEWNDYKNKGYDENEREKLKLNEHLEQMTENFEIISKNLEKNLKTEIKDIDRKMENEILDKNEKVAKKIFKDLDKDAIGMSRDNVWMKEKIEVYKKELQELQEYTTNLEQENIKLMAYLFECNSQEVKFIKNVFTTQFLDNENLEENSIMNVDLETLDSVRPNSALDLTIKKLKEIDLRSYQSDSRSQLVTTENQNDTEDEYLSNPKFAQKTLVLNGYRKQLIKPPTPSDEEIKAQNFKGEDWPVTQNMLSDALKHN